jgi:hypothetical protein
MGLQFIKQSVIIQTKKTKRGESNGIEKMERRIPKTTKFYEEWIPMHQVLRSETSVSTKIKIKG